MNRLTIADKVPLPSTRKMVDGVLHVKASIARTGIQEYHASELGLNDNKFYKIYRSEEEVFNQDSLASFEGVPVTDDHSFAQDREVCGTVGGVHQAGSLMNASLMITNSALIQKIGDGKIELSNGYSYQLDMTPGVTPEGEEYDGVQRNIIGDHVAVVDSGRCGSACRIADNSIKQGVSMSTRKVVVNGVTLELEDSTASTVETLINERDAALQRAGDAAAKLTNVEAQNAEILTLKSQLADAAKKITDLEKDVMTPEQRDSMVADWSKMIADAKRLCPEIKTEQKTCEQIRKEVLTTLAGNDTYKHVIDAVLVGGVDKASSEHIKIAFRAVSAVQPANAADAAFLPSTGRESDKLTGRDAYLAQTNKHLTTGA